MDFLVYYLMPLKILLIFIYDGNKPLNTHKTWFSKTCENKRKKFHKAGAKYNKNKNYNTRRNMKIYPKEYKRTMQESNSKFNDSFANEQRQTSKSDSREFWNRYI